MWVYAILFLILFLRNRSGGDAVPAGDSLLFVAGALAALPTNDLNVHTMVALMVVAAILGDAVNYTIGRLFGEAVQQPEFENFPPQLSGQDAPVL